MRQLREFILTTLIGGVIVLLPIIIMIWVVRILVTLIETALRPLTSLINLEVPDIVLNIIALVAVILFSFVIGLVVRTRFGSTLYNYVEEQWLERIPVYSSIRDIVQQFSGRKKPPFNQVVIVKGFGLLMTGFVTDDNGDDMYTVFVPTAPNPTNGFVFHVHKNNLQFVDVKTESAMRTVVGMGVGSQELLNPKEELPG